MNPEAPNPETLAAAPPELAGVAGYELLVPPRILFGWGRRAEVGRAAAALGRRAFLITGSRSLAATGENARLAHRLTQAGLATRHLVEITHEPLAADVDEAADLLAEHDPRAGDVLVALGGGSAIDLAKALAALATNPAPGGVSEYLEGVGSGRQLTEEPLPIVALPTTAGTGAEATKNAVISSYDPPFKKSLRAPGLLPKLVIVDPELTVTNPDRVTIHSGLDAVTQLIESYLTRQARPLLQAWIRQVLPGALAALPVAVREPSHRPAREALAQAALVSGICLANSGLGLAHGVAAALGCVCELPHGLACAVMLPTALAVNRRAKTRELAELEAAVRGDLPRDLHADAAAFVARIEGLVDGLGVPRRWSSLGVDPALIPALVTQSHGNSRNGNPVDLSDAELSIWLEQLA